MTTSPALAPGIYYDLPAEKYFPANGVSNSQLKHLNPPARYPVAMATRTETTPFMRMGTLVHSAILEPDKPLPGIVKQPETYTNEKGEVKPWHNGSKTCKQWAINHRAIGWEIMTGDEFDTLTNCVRALERDPLAMALLGDPELTKTEVSVWAPLKLPSGRTVTRRARLDAVRAPVAADIKVVQEGMGAKREFERLAFDRRYHVQAAYYMDAWNEVCDQGQRIKSWLDIANESERVAAWNSVCIACDTDFWIPDHHRAQDYLEKWNAACDQGQRLQAFVFLVVERAAPWLVSRYEIAHGSEVYNAGREQYIRDLETYAECKESGVWPGYQEGFQAMELPGWVKRNLNR